MKKVVMVGMKSIERFMRSTLFSLLLVMSFFATLAWADSGWILLHSDDVFQGIYLNTEKIAVTEEHVVAWTELLYSEKHLAVSKVCYKLVLAEYDRRVPRCRTLEVHSYDTSDNVISSEEKANQWRPVYAGTLDEMIYKEVMKVAVNMVHSSSNAK